MFHSNVSTVNDFLDGPSLACSQHPSIVFRRNNASCLFTSSISGAIFTLFVCVFVLQTLGTTQGLQKWFSKQGAEHKITPGHGNTEDSTASNRRINTRIGGNTVSQGSKSALQLPIVRHWQGEVTAKSSSFRRNRIVLDHVRAAYESKQNSIGDLTLPESPPVKLEWPEVDILLPTVPLTVRRPPLLREESFAIGLLHISNFYKLARQQSKLVGMPAKSLYVEVFASSMLTRLQNDRQDKATKEREAGIRIIFIYSPLAICTFLGNVTTYPSHVWQGALSNLSMIVYTIACAHYAFSTAQATANFRDVLHIDRNTATSYLRGLSQGDASVLRRAMVIIRFMGLTLLVLWFCCTFIGVRRMILIGGCKLMLFTVWVGEGYIVGTWQVSVVKEVARVHRKAFRTSVDVQVTSRREGIVRKKMAVAIFLMVTNAVMASMQVSYFVSLSILDSRRFGVYFSIELVLILIMGFIQTSQALRTMWRHRRSHRKKMQKVRPHQQLTTVSSSDIIHSVQSSPRIGLFDECEHTRIEVLV